MATVALFFSSFIISVFAVGGTQKAAIRLKIGALPNARKIHKSFTPVLGGIGIFAGLVFGILLAILLGILPVEIWIAKKYFWLGLVVILFTGIVDDVRGVNAWQKFGGQFIAAGLMVYGGCNIEAFYSPGGGKLMLGWSSFPFSVLWIMLIMNAINLLDGLDGLCAGISLIMMTGFLVLSIIIGNLFLIVLSIVFIGALLGFLKFNYHPASIFMGDVGSLMLGYILAYYSVESLKIANSSQVYFLASLVLLGLPLTDTLISFFRRMGQGDHPFKADREHIHHRLLNLGLSHLDSVWLMYYFALLYTGLGVLMVLYRELAGLLLFGLAFVFSIFLAWRLGYVETKKFISFNTIERTSQAYIRPLIHVDRIWHQIALLFGDILSINLAMYLTYWFRFQSGMVNPLHFKTLQDYFAGPVWLVITGIWLLLFWLNGLYRMSWDVSRFNKIMRMTKIISFGILLLLLLLNLDILMNTNPKSPFNQDQLSTLAFYWVAMIVFVSGIRIMIINVEKRLHIFEYDYKNTLVIGATRKARNIINDIDNNPHFVNKIVGIVESKPQQNIFEGYPVLGDYNDLPNLIQQHKIAEIIITISENSKEDLLNIIATCDRLQVVMKTLPSLQTIVSGRNSDLAGHALIRVFPENMVLWQWVVKRLFDISLSALVLLFTLPAWLALAITLRIKLKENPFIKLPILGKNGRVFNMYLFRMSNSGDQEISNSVYLGAKGDLGLEPLGAFLYRTRLYKFPQLFNILKGDMSLVGPRPETPDWYRNNQQRLRLLHRRLTIRPGLTGISQIKYRFDKSGKQDRERLKYDIFYSENTTLNFDLRIILRSLPLMFAKHKNE